jgi:hypothetical protein
VLRTFEQGAIGEFFERRQGIAGDEYRAERAEELAELFAQASAFYAKQLAPIEPELVLGLQELTAGWDPRRWDDLAVRYLGFPIWDVLLYPIQELAQIGEGDRIEVTRMSPAESKLLPAPDGMPVQGVKRFHFYAFFDRRARENDYLRGRLDAAEQLIGLLFESVGRDDSTQAWCKQAFEAIMAEEAGALAHIEPKLAAINEQIAGL